MSTDIIDILKDSKSEEHLDIIDKLNHLEISTIENEIDEIEEKVLQDEGDLLKYLTETFSDGLKDVSVRCRAIEELWDRSEESCLELVNKVCLMYTFSPIHTLKELLIYIVKHSFINNAIKNECAKTIYNQDVNLGYECFMSISKKMNDLSTPIQIDIIRRLIETKLYFEYTSHLFCQFITNHSIECEYRYKTLLSIQNDKERLYIDEYLENAYIHFVRNTKTYTRYRILGSQFILQNKNISTDIKRETETICIDFAKDNQLDYNLRADAADLLVRLGTEQGKCLGRDIIILLGRNPNGITTVYTDRQNVHDEQVDESIREMILQIGSIRLKTVDGVYMCFDDIQKEIETRVPSNELDKVRSSLLRIYIDQSIYEGGQMLHTIFLKVWQLIIEHENSESLKNRLVDELIDMADTCSSGHISRIVNVFSGFEVDGKMFSINIGWKKQIQSNLMARLYKQIQFIEDIDVQEKILDEMMTSGNIYTKPNLSTFFRNNLFSIRDELLKEFTEHMTEYEFDEYFRSAITFIEEGA